MIVTQILVVSTKRNVKRRVLRMWILVLRFKVFTYLWINVCKNEKNLGINFLLSLLICPDWVGFKKKRHGCSCHSIKYFPAPPQSLSSGYLNSWVVLIYTPWWRDKMTWPGLEPGHLLPSPLVCKLVGR